ncbi:glycosyltransferase [Mesohalobacter halotolerans]|uniref:Glycosyltransferase n=1 Tax=Mesohalobacter halotolerans TaxID=1883405 RepID=A0A4U5TRT6_9FLAO|nr:glycosyltransferase [Mesohalobacter halotolerans]
MFFFDIVLFFAIDNIDSRDNKNVFHRPLSVIIAAKNEAQNLTANLPFILNQNYPQFEVIVVND